MSPDGKDVDRRTVLGTLGAGATLAIAGCVGGDDDAGDEQENGVDDTDSQEGGHDDTDDHDDGEQEALDEPTEFPDEEECAVCSMITGEYPEWNAQVVHEDGHRTYFCSSGCMSAYYADPGHFDGPETDIVGAWVTDYETGDLIDASEAYFVRVADSDHVDDIMMMNPTPFADRTDAEAFVDDFEEYDDEDIITLEEFDMELAMHYRARFFDEDGGDGDHSHGDDGHSDGHGDDDHDGSHADDDHDDGGHGDSH